MAKYTQPKLPMGEGTAQQFDPVETAVQGARSYAASVGRTHTPLNDQLQVDPRRGMATSHEWDRGVARAQAGGDSQAERGKLHQSYRALAQETDAQFAHMTKPQTEGGMGLSYEPSATDPYSSPQEMASDITQNKRIKAFASASTGTMEQGHPFLSNDENDRFRAVHDVMGHAATGRGFSRHGEEAAYQSHAQMYSDTARPALAIETRAQNSSLIYNNRGDSFPDQSTIPVMPKWVQSTGKLQEPPDRVQYRGGHQLSMNI